MHVCDASAIIHAWDNYPVDKFPVLWDWFKGESESGKLLFPWIVRDEVNGRSPECFNYLLKPSAVSQHKISPSNDIFTKALEIEATLGIVGSKYHSKGVGGNDILIVSAAFVKKAPLVNNELQLNLPQNMAKYKIPSVCNLSNVSVRSLDVLTYIKEQAPVCG